MDLVNELKSLWKNDQYSIHKVKAHRKFSEATSSEDAWAILANHIADRSADAALQNESPEVSGLAENICEYKSEHFKKLRAVLVYILELNMLRMKLQRENKENLNPRIHGIAIHSAGSISNEVQADPYAEAFQKLLNWNPLGYETWFQEPLHDRVKDACSLGRSIAQTFWLWLQQLKWPTRCRNSWVWLHLRLGYFLLRIGNQFWVELSGAFPHPIKSRWPGNHLRPIWIWWCSTTS